MGLMRRRIRFRDLLFETTKLELSQLECKKESGVSGKSEREAIGGQIVKSKREGEHSYSNVAHDIICYSMLTD